MITLTFTFDADKTLCSNISHMATVLMGLFDLPAIPLCDVPSNVPGGVKINLLESAFDQSMPILFTSFCNHSTDTHSPTIFDPHTERVRLTSRIYGRIITISRCVCSCRMRI